jgi:acyl carrier protein
MKDTEQKLIDCFSVVFPTIDRELIPVMAMVSFSEWDSMNTMNLVAIIEEKFNFEIPADGANNFLSFDLILEYLETEANVSLT